MTFSEYQAIKAINASFLKACSFGAYEGWNYLNKPPFESDAMTFGSAVHCALLEPDLFNDRYAISEKFDRRTKAGKESAIAFEAANIGKTVIDSDEWAKIQLIKRRCDSIEDVNNALATFEKEKTFVFGEDKRFKARLDLVDLKNGVVIDIKTSRDAGPREFLKQLLGLRYDIQMLHYCRAINATTAYVIAIESESAEVALYDITDIVFSDFTQSRYENALVVANEVLGMKECPPKFETHIVNLTLPEWALKESV